MIADGAGATLSCFAEGVVMFAFMPLDERMAVARRAVNWAGSTEEVKTILK